MTLFKDMPSHSRVWIYQSDREFSANELELLKKMSEEFVLQWTSHNQLMNACIEIFYDWFIVICVDEKTAPASGCGIDKSVHFIQQIEKDIHSFNEQLTAFNNFIERAETLNLHIDFFKKDIHPSALTANR